MKDIDLLNISLMEIQIFLNAADYGAFAGAARDLHITPGMVSKRIVALEEKTGLMLFRREGNRVALTPAGKELQQEWSKVIQIAGEGILQAHQVQKVERETVNFRICFCYNPETLLMPIVTEYRKQEPQFQYKVELSLSFDCLPFLLSGDCDIGFVPLLYQKAVEQEDGLRCACIACSPLYAGMLPTNPLARKSSISIEDIRPMELMLDLPGEKTDYRQTVLDLCAKAGFQPKVYPELRSGGIGAYLNLTENRIFITDRFYHAFDNPRAAYIPIENTQSGILMVYREKASSQMKSFIRFVENNFLEIIPFQNGNLGF